MDQLPHLSRNTRVEEFDSRDRAAQIAGGHAAAAPPSSLMKSRHRLNCIRSPTIRDRAQGGYRISKDQSAGKRTAGMEFRRYDRAAKTVARSPT